MDQGWYRKDGVHRVLILVIVDVVLMDKYAIQRNELIKGLNPCYSGCCSDGL